MHITSESFNLMTVISSFFEYYYKATVQISSDTVFDWPLTLISPLRQGSLHTERTMSLRFICIMLSSILSKPSCQEPMLM